jgi:catechol 2,3-dioxygenase
MAIHPDTTVGPVHLTVSNLDRALGFYTGALGFSLARRQGTTAVLSADTSTPLVVLTEVPGAGPQPRRSTGLYHFAILVPGRAALARALRRLLGAGYPIHGASDHLVSEALYLADPDGNGIEVYADRPRAQWPRRDEAIVMDTRALDLEGLLAELDKPPSADGRHTLDPTTRIGHIHLRVSDLRQSEAFYHGVLGFEVMQRDYPGALFVAAGGYHHHIGMNVWAGIGALPPPSGAAGLQWFAICLHDEAELQAVFTRMQTASVGLHQTEAGWFLRDPSHNGILLTSGRGLGIAEAAVTVPLDAARPVA